jgi:hypothetical protein
VSPKNISASDVNKSLQYRICHINKKFDRCCLKNRSAGKWIASEGIASKIQRQENLSLNFVIAYRTGKTRRPVDLTCCSSMPPRNGEPQKYAGSNFVLRDGWLSKWKRTRLPWQLYGFESRNLYLKSEHSCLQKKHFWSLFHILGFILFNTVYFRWYNNVRIPASGITIFRHFLFLNFMHFIVHADTEHVATNFLISLLCIFTYSDRFPILDGI